MDGDAKGCRKEKEGRKEYRDRRERERKGIGGDEMRTTEEGGDV